MMRVGLVGLGDAGRHHGSALLALDAEAQLKWTAVCARSVRTVESFREALNVPARVASFGSLAGLLDSGLCDAVILATPDGVHAEQVEKTALAGLHVLVEKPLALTLAEAERAVGSARRANVQLRVGYHLRHHAGHQAVLAAREQLLGELQRMSISWAWPDPALNGWRAKGEGQYWSLTALGTHCFDLALWASGVQAASDAVVLTRPDQGLERSAEVTLRLDRIFAHVSVSVEQRAISRWILSGARGEVECIGTLGARGGGQILHRVGRGPVTTVDFEPVNPYLAQLRDFVRAAPRGFEQDALVANVDALERVAAARRMREGAAHGPA